MRDNPVGLRPGNVSDAVKIAALSVHVFLDTYATEGVRDDLAREAFREYSEAAFAQRLQLPSRRFVLAESRQALLGFAEFDSSHEAPVGNVRGFELVRLYVQPRAQRAGLGSELIQHTEAVARQAGARNLWLTVWEGNARALAFYALVGYSELGATSHVIEGRAYGNKVLAKELHAV